MGPSNYGNHMGFPISHMGLFLPGSQKWLSINVHCGVRRGVHLKLNAFFTLCLLNIFNYVLYLNLKFFFYNQMNQLYQLSHSSTHNYGLKFQFIQLRRGVHWAEMKLFLI